MKIKKSPDAEPLMAFQLLLSFLHFFLLVNFANRLPALGGYDLPHTLSYDYMAMYLVPRIIIPNLNWEDCVSFKQENWICATSAF